MKSEPPTQHLYLKMLLVLIFLVSLILPRFAAIERPITVDELTWLTFSADFYYGLGQREWAHTYQDHHPGVTTMLAGTAAYLIEFPGYRGQGQGYMENDTFKLIDYLNSSGVSMFDVLLTARRIMAGWCVLALLLSLWFLWKTFGAFPAFVGMMFVALDPMTIGQNRLYSHEGLMSTLVLLTWVSFFYYLKKGKNRWVLLFSGVAMGFAALTKVTSLGLMPVVGLAWLVDFWLSRRAAGERLQPFWKDLFRQLWPLLIWVLVVVVVFVGVWPAMWADPVGQMIHLIQHTSGFSGNGNAGANALLPTSQDFVRVGDYLGSIWSHTTLITWAGVLLLGVAVVWRKRLGTDKDLPSFAGYLLLYGLVVILVIGLFVRAILGVRYMSSVHLALALLAGLGFAAVLSWAVQRFSLLEKRRWLVGLAVGGLLVIQVITFFPARPYYYTYNQPFRTTPWWGTHGAFLDQAADYLAAKPNAVDLTVMTPSPGSFMFFFPGETLLLVPNSAWRTVDIERLAWSDFLVVDFTTLNKPAPSKLITTLANAIPEHTISFQGRTLVWIYKVSDLPPEAFVPDTE